MASQLYSGTHAVDTTEWSCTTDSAGPDADTTPGKYQLVLDVSDMVAGDMLQVRAYEQARAGDTQRLLQEWILAGAQASPLWMSPDLTLLHGWDFTLDALAGTITVLWSIRDTDQSLTALATAANLTTLTNYVDTEVAAILAAVDTEVAAIKTKTDSLTFTVAGQVDANIQAVNDVTVTGTGAVGDEWGP